MKISKLDKLSLHEIDIIFKVMKLLLIGVILICFSVIAIYLV